MEASWREQVYSWSNEELWAALPLLENITDPDVSEILLRLWPEREDFGLRFRILLAVRRLAQPETGILLWDLISREKATHWRLLALEIFLETPATDKASRLSALLLDDDGLFRRGVVWALASLGQKALPVLAAFALTPASLAIRAPLLNEALCRSAGGGEQLLLYASVWPEFDRWLRYRIFTDGQNYDIYPYPDYLLQKALAAGLSRREWYDLFRQPRKKDPHILSRQVETAH
ncbi:MAG: hypothetical protein FWF85_03340 [Clostridiales bacterium]|nr:hypothetical protein [Clostridiales bacterium]MDR2713047.1 hypothetical protein [Clostridiales bacterium]